MTSNYNSAVKTTVNEDVIHAVRRILEIAADEGVSLAPALSRGLAEALTPQRAGAGTCTDAVSGSARTQETPCSTPCARQVQAPAQTQSAAPAGASACTEAVSGSARTQEVSGWYTPEEAAELIGKIRGWLSGCREGHRLADLMEGIKAEFRLYDGQMGELLGISGRLVGYVRHGRPSPFALTRFTEIFGTDGSAREN